MIGFIENGIEMPTHPHPVENLLHRQSVVDNHLHGLVAQVFVGGIISFRSKLFDNS